mmetsp:Transcript_41296/g.103242  ORF Transcript_41296/g.103242 Transcript_41296/m.103242 type:complete len:203 (+) Transcript_41296:2565-3173(+)
MVLRSHVALASLAVCCRPVVDMFANGTRPHKRNRSDSRMVAEKVDSILATVKDVEDACRQPRLGRQSRKHHARRRNPLGWLEDKSVSRSNGDGHHPKRNHGGKIERSDTGNHSQGLLDGDCVHVPANLLHRLPHHVRWHRHGMLNHLNPSEHVAVGIGLGLAVFLDNGPGNLILCVIDQSMELHQNSHSLLHRNLPPRLLRC